MTPSWQDPRTWRRRLVFLRGSLVTLLALLYLVADWHAASPLPTLQVGLWLALLWLPSVIFLLTRNRPPRWQWWLCGMEVLVDQLLFLALLHQLGGSANPLAFYLLLPVLIGALALPPAAAGLQVVVAISGYGLTLHWHNVPYHHPHLHALTNEIHPDHGLGMWLAFAAVAVVLTLLGQLLRQAQQREQRSQGTALTLALQRERMYQVGATLADRAHELNTPLSTLLLISESLAEDPALPESRRNDARQIGELARRISILLRPTAPDSASLAQPRHLSSLCEELALTLRHLAPTLTVRWQGPADPALTQSSSWQRVLANLGYNACDAGASTLDIACVQTQSGWLIQVSDDGPRQADQPGREGLGIGLALVETSLAALGATLELTFERQWTQARIQLPRILGAQPAPDSQGEPA